jgi:ribosomal protein L17
LLALGLIRVLFLPAPRLSRPSRARQALVADSLLLDLNSAIKTGRERARLERDLADRHAELSEMKSAERRRCASRSSKPLRRPEAMTKNSSNVPIS